MKAPNFVQIVLFCFVLFLFLFVFFFSKQGKVNFGFVYEIFNLSTYRLTRNQAKNQKLYYQNQKKPPPRQGEEEVYGTLYQSKYAILSYAC